MISQTIKNYSISILISLTIFGCAGGGGGGGVTSTGAVTSKTALGGFYDSHQVTKTYANGTSATLSPVSGPVTTWGANHITRTDTYTYSDGDTASWSLDFAPTTSTATLTAASYAADWATTGAVTAPSVSAVASTYGDGYVSTSQNGTSSKPFLQTTLSAQSITDPSAYVTSSTSTYNLNWGTPDRNGPAYANLFPNASNTLSSALSYAGISVAGQATAGPTLLQPSADVLAAWNSGWTGKGSNILVIDSYANKGGCTSGNGNCHGVITMMNTDLIAPGANKYGLDFAFTTNFTGTAFDINGTNLASSKSINVVNMSWLFTAPVGNWNCNNGACTAPTNLVYNNGIADTATTHSNLMNVLNGVTNVTNLSNLSGSVITSSAGNDNLDTKYNLTALALSGDASVASRLLIVGALDKNGTVASKATKASYSNSAGVNTAISDRFVTAYGNMPWTAGSVKINGSNFGVQQGTSFAAPLVAGYAAIVMQKFPNLNAVNTSNIILDTARTDTINGYDSSIHGKGEASLSRALAPVGRLR